MMIDGWMDDPQQTTKRSRSNYKIKNIMTLNIKNLIHSFYSMQRSIHKDNHNHFFVSVKSIAFFSHVSYFEYESLAIAINKSLTSHRNIYMYIDNQNWNIFGSPWIITKLDLLQTNTFWKILKIKFQQLKLKQKQQNIFFQPFTDINRKKTRKKIYIKKIIYNFNDLETSSSKQNFKKKSKKCVGDYFPSKIDVSLIDIVGPFFSNTFNFIMATTK